MTDNNFRTRSIRLAPHWLPVVVLVLLGILAARPLLSLQFFYSDDGLDHLLRLFALDQTIHQGIIYPRWLFDLAYGYGYPIFNFYPPLAAYVAETLHLLGLSFADAIKGTELICIVVALVGAYAMGAAFFRDAQHAQTAGTLTAVAYTFFPYFLIDIYARGALAEALAVALLPWLIWSLRRGLRQSTLGSALMIALLSALLLLTHSFTLFIVAPVLILYVLLGSFALPAVTRRLAFVRVTASALLGAGLSTIYWFPFGAELNLVKMGKGIASIVAVFRDHFLAPSNLIQSSLFYRYGDAPFALGIVPVVLGILAIVIAGFARRRLVLFFGIVAILAAAAMIEPARGAWLVLPFATMVQYPWRVSILVGLGFSIAIGALPLVLGRPVWLNSPSSHLLRQPPVHRRVAEDAEKKIEKPLRALRLGGEFAAGLSSYLSSRMPRFALTPVDLPKLVVTVAIAGALIGSAVANLTPQQVFFPRNAPTVAQLARFEAYSSFVGTTTWGEYLPATVGVSNLSTYRAPPAQPNENATQVQIDQWASSVRAFRVSASQPISLSLRSFYFPGWQATVDGAPTRAFATTPLGLLTTTVPPGQHRIAFTLNDTLPQRAGTIISILSALVFGGLAGVAFRRGEKDARVVAPIFALTLAMFLIPASAALAAQPQAPEQKQVAVSPQLDLIGLAVDHAQLEAGVWHIADARDSLSLQAYWFTKSSVDDKPFKWRLLDHTGQVSSQSEQASRYGTGNVAAWIPNEIVHDQFDLPPSPALPPGNYALQVALGGDFVTVGSVDFERGSAPAPSVNIAHRVDARVGSQIELVGYNAPQTAHPGTTLPLTLYWQANQSVTNDYTAFVQLLDSGGNVAARPQHDTIPGGGLNPTSLWQPGALIVDRQDFDLPHDLQPGLYHLIAGMYHYPNLTRLPVEMEDGPAPDDVVTLGNIKMPMNAQNATRSHVLDVSLGSAIQLNGYDLQIQPQQIAVKLYWQARTRIDNDYKVFVHISNAQGQVIAQQDSLPDAGRYPTRIWDAGEQVLDAYQISTTALAAGRYTIFVGMYSPDTGERLPITDKNGNALPDRQIELAQFDIPGRSVTEL